MAAAAGAAYVLLFSYVGSTFAGIEYSILPLLWVLLGGAGTMVGPFVGTLLMFYLVECLQRLHLGLHARGRRGCWCCWSCSSPRASPAPSAKDTRHGCRDAARHPRPEPPVRRAQCRRAMWISRCSEGEIRAVIGPNGAGKTTLVEHDLRPHRSFGAGGSSSRARTSRACAPGSGSRAASSTPSRSPASSGILPASTMWRWRHSGMRRARHRRAATASSMEALDRVDALALAGAAPSPRRCPTAISGCWRWRSAWRCSRSC